MQDKKIPNLFIVGAPKCGSTSMHNWLSRHPEIFMSKDKEPWFFAADKLREADEYNQQKTPEFKYRNKKDYFSLFSDAGPEKYRGESSTRYIFSKTAPAGISRLQPRAKIIIMLRNPVDFMYSFHSEKMKGGAEDIENFEKALQAEPARKQYKKMPRKVVCPSDLFYSELARFSGYIEKYQNYFPGDQIKIVILEEIKKNPAKIYKEILEFLKVEDTDFIPEFHTYNANAKVRSRRLSDFIKNSVYTKKAARLILPDKIRKKITLTAEEWNKKTVQRPPLPDKTRKELMAKFKPEVQKLAGITGKDLKAIWGGRK